MGSFLKPGWGINNLSVAQTLKSTSRNKDNWHRPTSESPRVSYESKQIFFALRNWTEVCWNHWQFFH